MVHILDEGSVFDAPLDKIWRYLQTAPEDLHVHRSMMNVQTVMEGDQPVMSFETEAPGGMKVKNKIKMTFFAPVGFLLEYTDGPLTGSKVMQHYAPMGNRTGVTVAGEYVSRMMPENQIKPLILGELEQAFKEDNANLQKFK